MNPVLAVPFDRKQYESDRTKLSDWELFAKYCAKQLDFKRCCALAQKGYFQFLIASYATAQAMRPLIDMSDAEWAAENGGVPLSMIEKVIKPQALKVEIE